jgi:hypothetical protein
LGTPESTRDKAASRARSSTVATRPVDAYTSSMLNRGTTATARHWIDIFPSRPCTCANAYDSHSHSHRFDGMRISRHYARLVGMALAVSGLPPLKAQRPQPAAVARSRSVSAAPGAPLRLTTMLAPRDSATGAGARNVVLGAVAGAVVGGLAGAAIGANQNATECVASGPAACPRKPDHTLLFTAGGLVVGAALGAMIVRSIEAIGR